MDRRGLDELKRRVPLLDYLQQHGWKACGSGRGPQWVGLCPVHRETRPSFTVHTIKNLFYCDGGGQGGDIFRLIQLLEQLSFPQAVARLRQRDTAADVIAQAAAYYQAQLPLHPEAKNYLRGRGIHDPRVLSALRAGYAPGASLRGYLASLGYAPAQMREAGLIDARGRDCFYRRIVFPCAGNLYGRGIDPALPPHRFLAGGKADCWDGSTRRPPHRSCWWKASSIWPRCGRPAIRTLSAVGTHA